MLVTKATTLGFDHVSEMDSYIFLKRRLGTPIKALELDAKSPFRYQTLH